MFALLAYFANLWPGWVTSSATLVTYLVGGDVAAIAIGMLLVIGLTLTMAPVVYQALEKIEMFKSRPSCCSSSSPRCSRSRAPRGRTPRRS